MLYILVIERGGNPYCFLQVETGLKDIFEYTVYFVVTDEFIAFHQSSMLLELRKAQLTAMFVISLCEK